MSKRTLQTIYAEVLARRHALNPKAIEDWALRHNINLEEYCIDNPGGDKFGGIMLDIVNDTTNSVKK